MQQRVNPFCHSSKETLPLPSLSVFIYHNLQEALPRSKEDNPFCDKLCKPGKSGDQRSVSKDRLLSQDEIFYTCNQKPALSFQILHLGIFYLFCGGNADLLDANKICYGTCLFVACICLLKFWQHLIKSKVFRWNET